MPTEIQFQPEVSIDFTPEEQGPIQTPSFEPVTELPVPRSIPPPQAPLIAGEPPTGSELREAFEAQNITLPTFAPAPQEPWYEGAYKGPLNVASRFLSGLSSMENIVGASVGPFALPYFGLRAVESLQPASERLAELTRTSGTTREWMEGLGDYGLGIMLGGSLLGKTSLGMRMLPKTMAAAGETAAEPRLPAEVKPELPVEEIGPGLSEPPEPVFPEGVRAPAREPGVTPAPARVEPGAAGKATAPAVPEPTAGVAPTTQVGPPITPTTTEVAKSQGRIPEPPPGQRLVTMRLADGTEEQVAFADKYWEVEGNKIPAIGRLTPAGWSHGMLPDGATLVEEAKPAAPAPKPEGGPNAIPIETPVKVHVQPTPEYRGEVGEGVRPPGAEPARTEAQAKAQEEVAKAAATPAAETEKTAKKRRGISRNALFDKETEMVGPGLMDWIKSEMPLLSAHTARRKWGRVKFRQNQSLYDDAPTLGRPHHNLIYSEKGSAPDVVAQAAYDAGKLSVPNASELWAKIGKESQTRHNAWSNAKSEIETLNQMASFEEITGSKSKNKNPMAVEDLKVGDEFEVDGEGFRVEKIDPDSGEVTLHDGRRFGVQRLPDGKTIYVENFVEAPTTGEPWPETPKEPAKTVGKLFSLEVPESVAEQKARLAQEQVARERKAAKEEMLDKSGKAITGTVGDLGQPDLLGQPQDLWAADAVKPSPTLLALTPKQSLALEQSKLAEAQRAAAAAKMKPGPGTTAKIIPMGETGAPMAKVGSQPVRVRLRDAQRLLDAKSRRAFGKGQLDLPNNRLVSEDGTHQLKYYGPGETMPDGSVASNKGSVQIESVPSKQLPKGETGAALPLAEPLRPGPGAMTAGAPRYHPISQLTDQLKANPRGSLPKDITAKEKIADAWAKGKSLIDHAFARMRAVSESLRQSGRGVMKIDDVVRRVSELDAALQTSTGRSIEAKKSIKVQMPNRTVREASALYLDSGRDVDAIRAALFALPQDTHPRIRRALEMAARETDELKRFADQIEQFYSVREGDAIEGGVFEHGIKDYFTHIWRREDNMPASLRRAMSNGQVNTYFQFGRQRKIGTFLEGIAQGKVPELDPADVVPFYNHALDRAIASRAFIKQLSEIDAADGRPVVTPSGTRSTVPRGGEEEALLIKPRAKGKIPVGPETPASEVERLSSMEGYETVNHPAMRKWKWAGTDEKGKPIFYEGDLLVHPDHYQRIARMMDRGRLTGGPIGRGLLAVSSEVKGSMFGLPSTFHALHVGGHGAFHWTNPFKDIRSGPIDWDSPRTVFAIEKGHLKIAPNPSELAQFSEGMMGRGIVSRLPYIREWSNAFTQWMFQEYIPKLKLRTFENAFARAKWLRDKAGLFKGLTEDEIAARTGDSVNNAYGELNRWFLGKHGREPWLQRSLQGTFLAPDFGEARLRFVGKAFTRYGHEERLALATMFLTLYTAARVANIISHGDPETDWRRAFSVKVGDRWYSMRSVVGDVDHAAADFGQFLFVRLNPVYSRTIIEGLFGRDIYGKKKTLLDNARDLAQTVVPIGLRGLTDPNKKLWESFSASMGVTPRLETPVQDINRLVADWKRKSTDPKIQAEVKRTDASVYPPSDYQGLHRALYDNDTKRAKKEIDKLLKTRRIDQVFDAMSPMSKTGILKAFTHSQELEGQFYSQLSPAKIKQYDKAIAQRMTEFSRLLELYK